MEDKDDFNDAFNEPVQVERANRVQHVRRLHDHKEETEAVEQRRRP